MLIYEMIETKYLESCDNNSDVIDQLATTGNFNNIFMAIRIRQNSH